jgi:hypothetical protein
MLFSFATLSIAFLCLVCLVDYSGRKITPSLDGYYKYTRGREGMTLCDSTYGEITQSSPVLSHVFSLNIQTKDGLNCYFVVTVTTVTAATK